MTLGALREFIGQGTILSGVHLMFGEAARSLSFSMGNDFHGLILAILPPGAFFGLGLLIALKHVIDKRNAKRAAEHTPASAAEPAPAEG
jgi:electron transport complex protein RnfE